MELYSEYHGEGRKATVTYIRQSEWARELDKWEVAFYVENKPLQRTTCRSQYDAEQIAEDFVQGYSASGPSLLNEHISNG